MWTCRWVFGALLLAGCSSGGITEPPPPPPSELLRVWDSSSLVADGVDATAQGMDIQLRFDNYGTYAIRVQGDLLELCDPDRGPNCFFGGDFHTTSTRSPDDSGPILGQFTLDPGTVDEVTLNYSISAQVTFVRSSLMTVTGTFVGTSITFTFWPSARVCC